MNIPWNGALVPMIQINIAGGGDQQFVHGTVDDLSTEDMAKRMEKGGDLHSDGEDHGLIQALARSRLGVEEIQEKVKAEENNWTQPGQRRDQKRDIPKLSDGNAPHRLQVFKDAVFEHQRNDSRQSPIAR